MERKISAVNLPRAAGRLSALAYSLCLFPSVCAEDNTSFTTTGAVAVARIASQPIMNPQYHARNGSRSSNGPLGQFDLDQMPETPPRGAHHRRALSETFFRLPDDLLFDVSDVDFSALDLPIPTHTPTPTSTKNTTNYSSQADIPMAVDSSRSDESSSDNRSSGTTTRPPVPAGHLRSLSVDADFFDGLSFGGMDLSGDTGNGGKTSVAASASAFSGGGGGGKKVGFHRRNHSMDGASSSSFEADSLMDGVKKAMTQEKLAELSLVDPKRAKRILANRQSAARSKERKIRYTSELERKVQTLQTEATTLSAQVTMLQRDTSGLNAENRELKLRLQAMEQQAHLRDALNEALREEVQRLRLATGQIPPNKNNAAASRGSNPFGSQQQPQFTAAQGSSMDDQNNSKRQVQSNFLDFNHRG